MITCQVDVFYIRLVRCCHENVAFTLTDSKPYLVFVLELFYQDIIVFIYLHHLVSRVIKYYNKHLNPHDSCIIYTTEGNHVVVLLYCSSLLLFFISSMNEDYKYRTNIEVTNIYICSAYLRISLSDIVSNVQALRCGFET